GRRLCLRSPQHSSRCNDCHPKKCAGAFRGERPGSRLTGVCRPVMQNCGKNAGKEGSAMETKWLAAMVSPGQFPTEYAVSGVQHNGKVFSLFAPREAVAAPPSGEGPGWLRVEVAASVGDLVLVRLPAETFENGHYVTVHARELQDAAAAQRIGA